MSLSNPSRSPETAYANQHRIGEIAATEAFVDGDFITARAGYRALVEQRPERLDLLARLAHLDLLENRVSSAVERLTKVLEGGLRTHTVLSQLAEAYLRRGDLGHAALTYQQLGREGLAGTLAAMAQLQPWRLEVPRSSLVLPWVRGEPLPVIVARVNGEAANLVIDTGAGDMALDTGFAMRAAVRFGGREWRKFAGGRPAEVLHGHVEGLTLATQDIHDIPVQMLDLQSTFAHWFPDLPIHGILGLRVLSCFSCTLDYVDRRLLLEPPVTGSSPGVGMPFWLGEDAM